MSELKTLKEIFDITDVEDKVHYNMVKKEAIKWVKADKSNFYSKEGMENTKDWIKHFFNITEEETKKCYLKQPKT